MIADIEGSGWWILIKVVDFPNGGGLRWFNIRRWAILGLSDRAPGFTRARWLGREAVPARCLPPAHLPRDGRWFGLGLVGISRIPPVVRVKATVPVARLPSATAH